MTKNFTEEWKKLFRDNCKHWDPSDKQRYVNIPNDPEEVDEEELNSSKELIVEINKKPLKQD